MEFRAGSSQDAEAIAGLIASFQSELTNDPSGADAEEYLASVSVRAEREYPGLSALPVSSRLLGLSTCRLHRHPRWLPPFSPLRRACTPTQRPRSRLVGASIARVGPFRESRSFHSQLKPCGRAGLPGVGFPSCRVNKKRPWHLVPSHAATRFTSVTPNPSAAGAAPTFV